LIVYVHLVMHRVCVCLRISVIALIVEKDGIPQSINGEFLSEMISKALGQFVQNPSWSVTVSIHLDMHSHDHCCPLLCVVSFSDWPH